MTFFWRTDPNNYIQLVRVSFLVRVARIGIYALTNSSIKHLTILNIYHFEIYLAVLTFMILEVTLQLSKLEQVIKKK